MNYLDHFNIQFEKAIKENQLTEFLIHGGYKDEYGMIDHEYIWRNILKVRLQSRDSKFKKKLEDSLGEFLKYSKDITLGLYTFFILTAKYYRALNIKKEVDERINYDLMIDDVKSLLINHKEEFVKDKRFSGYLYPDGMLGVFNHQVNVIKNELGGPDFSIE